VSGLGGNEYEFVERPFLAQLKALGWSIIDHGNGVPTDPTISHRAGFREIVLRADFKQAVSAINLTPDGRPWLTDAQLEDLYDQVTARHLEAGKSLLEINETILGLFYKATVDRNELTGEASPAVLLIDFEHPSRNQFLAINQFRIDTPGRVKDHIRPDLVLFVNGMPLVVVECKDTTEFTANPMFEAFQQLMRYSDQRPGTHEAGLKEGEPRLFYTNQLLIRTTGDKADMGSISSTDEEYFFPWKDIYPEKFRKFDAPLGKVRQQETLIQGLLAPETLLDVVRSFVVFTEVGKKRVKVLPRYQQYRAVMKMLERLRTGATPEARSGVIWHTQGSGKSLTMVFAIRKIRHSEDVKDFKIILVNDRLDLEKQLSETAALAGEKAHVIGSSDALKRDLANTRSDLSLVMMHKFHEAQQEVPVFLQGALMAAERIPVFTPFGQVNDSARILLMIDEAHRTQSSELGDNLFAAFPNAARVAFTGTPLITERHLSTTEKRFYGYIDKYRLQDAVEDGVTVQILYEGKTAESALYDPHGFDTKFEDLFRERTEDEIAAIRKKYVTKGDLLDAPALIKEKAADMVAHYLRNIFPNGFKAQVVTNSKAAAIEYKKCLDDALRKAVSAEEAKATVDLELVRRLKFLKTAVVLSSDGTNEAAELTLARKQAQEMDAIGNFKRAFDLDDPGKANTGIAFMVVCDMLLTGFDAPIEQVMYLDKKLTEHNLLQAIARVNRVYQGKVRGYIVDYVGLMGHLTTALAIYATATAEEREDVTGAFKMVLDEVPVLQSRFQRLVNFFRDKGVKDIEAFARQKEDTYKATYEVLEQAIELLKDERLRATYEVQFKQFLQSLDIVLPHPAGMEFWVPAKRFGYLFAQVKERYKDDSINLVGVGAKVKKLINEHLVSLGINPKIQPIELIDKDFGKKVNEHSAGDAKAKASEMEHAIRKHIKVHLEEDPAFFELMSEKLEALIQRVKEDWQQLCLELEGITGEIANGRKEDAGGLGPKVAPFHDVIIKAAYGKTAVPVADAEKIQQFAAEAFRVIKGHIGLAGFWSRGNEIKALRGELLDLVLYAEVDALMAKQDEVVEDLVNLARARAVDVLA
jgi:type I restriction enzyme R subunit